MVERIHDHLEPEESIGAIGGYGPAPFLTLRSALGGVLMGIANLVPGISGGSMLLAAGVYPRFLRAIAELSRLRLQRLSLWVLLVVGISAVATIATLGGAVREGLVAYRWVTYSLFTGFTLGGVLVVTSLVRPVDRRVWVGAVAAALPMAALSWLQAQGVAEAASREGALVLFGAGIVSAVAVLVPGVSVSYVLGLLGVYAPLFDAFALLRRGSLGDALGPALAVLAPFLLGMLVGFFGMANLYDRLLRRFEKPTLGVLLGLLAGSVVGLYPFREGRLPVVGEVFRGAVMTPERIAALPTHSYPTEYFAPSGGQIAGALALVLAGFVITSLASRFGVPAGPDHGEGRDPLRTGS